jgi:proline dehydrogenase
LPISVRPRRLQYKSSIASLRRRAKGGEIVAGADVAAKVAALVDRLIADQAL